MAFFLFSMKNIIVGFTALILLNGCNDLGENIENDSQTKVVVSEAEIDNEDTYRRYVLKNRIDTDCVPYCGEQRNAQHVLNKIH